MSPLTLETAFGLTIDCLHPVAFDSLERMREISSVRERCRRDLIDLQLPLELEERLRSTTADQLAQRLHQVLPDEFWYMQYMSAGQQVWHLLQTVLKEEVPVRA